MKGKAKAKANITIVVDTREQLPYLFDGRAPTVRRALDAGDYSIVGSENRFAIERKTSEDAWQTFSRGRRRFVRELEKLSKYDYAAIVIESSFAHLLVRPRHVRRVQPATIAKSIVHWSIQYGVHVWLASDRAHGEALTLRLCEYFAIEKGR